MYKYLLNNRKAVVFDLDGTLINTEPFWEEAIKEVCNEMKVDIAEYYLNDTHAGQPLLTRWKKILMNADKSFLQNIGSIVAHTNEVFLDLIKDIHFEPRRGFISLAKELKADLKIPLGLATGSPKSIAEQLIAKLDIDSVFDACAYGDEVSKGKPDPEIYRLVAKRLNVRSKQLLVFEDSPTGVTSAINAGARVVVMFDGTFREKDYSPHADLILPDFGPLQGLMTMDKKAYSTFKFNTLKNFVMTVREALMASPETKPNEIEK